MLRKSILQWLFHFMAFCSVNVLCWWKYDYFLCKWGFQFFQSNGRVASTQKQTCNFQFPFDISDENIFFTFDKNRIFNFQSSEISIFNQMGEWRLLESRQAWSSSPLFSAITIISSVLSVSKILIILSSTICRNFRMSSPEVQLVTFYHFSWNCP